MCYSNRQTLVIATQKTTMFAKLQILYMSQCRTGKGVGMKINLRHIHDAFNGIYPILF